MTQAADQYKYLKFTSLEKTLFWDFYTLINKNAVASTFPIVKLAEVLSQRKGFITINDSELYKRCRVQVQGKGVVLRDEVTGTEIKTKKQQLCKTDDLLVAEIDAKVGGFGIVPQALNGAIVSGHYFLFEINRFKLLPEYLGLVVRQEGFLHQVKSTGSTNYSAIRPHHVLEYQIPLPSIEDQEELVRKYLRKVNEASSRINVSRELRSEIGEYLSNKLGIIPRSGIEKSSLLQLIQFTETKRWDTLFLLGKLPGLQSKYPLVSFLKSIKSFNRDANNRSIRADSFKFPDDDFRYIGMEHVEKDTGRLLDMPLVKGREIKSQTIRVPKDFIIYGKLRPYLNKYWINETDFDNIICSSEFFVFSIHSKINKIFFISILSSKIIQDQITDKTSGARMPRINEETFLSLQFPLPPIEIQNQIASRISSFQFNVEESRLDAANLKLAAEQEFNNHIFVQ